MTAPIEQALRELRAGKLIIVTDDEKRENEGDLVCAAEKVTPEIINFMVKEGRGLVCVPLREAHAGRLDFHPMVSNPNGNCNFTVSVDAFEGTTTGISAFDRCATIRKMLEPTARPEDFMRPGHVFPLIAVEDGVLKRPGHTEAAADLAELAGLAPAGVICEIMNSDGTMARLPDLELFAGKHGLNIYTIQDLIEYRRTAPKDQISLKNLRLSVRSSQ